MEVVVMFERSHEEHNGHANYETWAFLAHITQTQELLNEAIEIARPMVDDEYHYRVIGETVVRHFQEWCWETIHSWVVYDPPQPWRDATLMANDVGSWWRIDENGGGRHMMEYVKESA